MIKAIVSICVLAAIVFGAGVIVGYYQVPPFGLLKAIKQRLPFSDAVSGFMARSREPKGAPDIVMLGDSLTADGDWAARFSGARIVNLAVSGNSSAGVLDRLDEATSRKPRMALLMIGVNDLLRDIPMDLTVRQIELVVTRLAASGTIPVVQSVAFVSKSWRPDLNDKIEALNGRLAAWCRTNRIAYVDVNAGLSSQGGLNPSFSTDGLHLNDKGYAVWADTIRPFVERASKDTQSAPGH